MERTTATRSSSRTIPKRATAVARLKDWDHGHGATGRYRLGNGYSWLTLHELLIFRFRDRGQAALGSDWWDLSRRDLRTGKETRLPALSALFRRYSAPPTVSFLSPDRRWLFWPGGEGYCAAKLDGSGLVTWPSSSARVDYHWLGDSRHWIELLYDSEEGPPARACVRDLRWPRSRRIIPIAPVPALGFNVAWNGHLLAYSLDERWGGSRCEVLDVPLSDLAGFTGSARFGRRGARPRTYRIDAPSGLVFAEAAFAGQGDRIAWICTPRGSRGSRGQRFFVWVSGIDGSRMHEACSIAGSQSDDAPPPWPGLPVRWRELKWLLEGTHVSFEHEGSLFRVPAGA